MRERPILFRAPMVRALLNGSKTQTRRAVKFPIKCLDTGCELAGSELSHELARRPELCPYGQPGDRLWVRETYFGNHYLHPNEPEDERELHYRADGYENFEGEQIVWRPSIFMPRWACRLELEITRVRVERLQRCSHSDAVAEGVYRIQVGSGYADRFSAMPTNWAAVVERSTDSYDDARLAYRDLWESINGAGSWAANPWVWVVEFKRAGQ